MQATRTLDLDARLLRREVLAAVPEGRVLGVVAFGGTAVETAGAPLVRMPLDLLESAGPGPEVEVWLSTDPEAPVAVGRHGAVELARDGRVLFGHLRAPAAGPRLEPVTLEVYRQVFAATGAERARLGQVSLSSPRWRKGWNRGRKKRVEKGDPDRCEGRGSIVLTEAPNNEDIGGCEGNGQARRSSSSGIHMVINTGERS